MIVKFSHAKYGIWDNNVLLSFMDMCQFCLTLLLRDVVYVVRTVLELICG